MLQTEFDDGSGSKLVISWDGSIDTNVSAIESMQDCDDLVEKVNHLYETISAFSAGTYARTIASGHVVTLICLLSQVTASFDRVTLCANRICAMHETDSSFET